MKYEERGIADVILTCNYHCRLEVWTHGWLGWIKSDHLSERAPDNTSSISSYGVTPTHCSDMVSLDDFWLVRHGSWSKLDLLLRICGNKKINHPLALLAVNQSTLASDGPGSKLPSDCPTHECGGVYHYQPLQPATLRGQFLWSSVMGYGCFVCVSLHFSAEFWKFMQCCRRCQLLICLP